MTNLNALGMIDSKKILAFSCDTKKKVSSPEQRFYYSRNKIDILKSLGLSETL